MVLQVKNLTYQFKHSEIPLFNGLSFTITNPGITCIVGKNGVGKSTLFKVLQGQQGAIGTITLADKEYDLSKSADCGKLQAQVKLMQQKVTTMLAPSFTVRENLQAAGLSVYPTISDFTESFYTLFGHEIVSLDQRVTSLSGGQKQIVALCMALQSDTKILLLDEPTAALDEKNAHYFMDFVHQLALERGMIVLCISHDPVLIQRFSENGALVLEHQNGVTSGTLK